MATTRERPEPDAQLLPFFVNGTLEREELERVRHYLQSSAPARDDAAFIDFVRSSVHRIDQVAEPTERERQRILERVCAPERRATWLLPYAALAAALVLALAEAAVLWRIAGGGDLRAPRPPADYHAAYGASNAEIAVQFRETASERDIRELLLERGLRIVEGPSARGVYGLVLANRTVGARDVEQALEELRAQGGIVTYAQRR